MRELTELRFVIPLVGSPASDSPQARVEFKLKPSDGKFELSPLGGVLAEEEGFEEKSEQWRLAYQGDLTATVVLPKDGGRVERAGITVSGADLKLTLGGMKTPDDADGTYHILLHGSLPVPIGSAGNDDFGGSLKKLWPMGERLGDEAEIRLEPAGLYLRGKLPSELFPPGFGGEEVVLRVPQHRERDRQEPQRRDGQEINGKRFWTLESFEFDAGKNSVAFVEGYAGSLKSFGDGDGAKTFIDNVDSQPGPKCEVRIWRHEDEDKIYWRALELGTRIMIGGDQASETTFFPDELTGAVTAANNGHHGPVRFQSGTERAGGHKISLKQQAGEGREPEFEFGEIGENGERRGIDLGALSVPTTLLAVEDGAGQEGRAEAEDVFRAWLCTEEGWLSLAAARPEWRLDPERYSQGAIRGVLEFEKIVRDLSGEEEGLSGMEVQVQALGDSYVSVELDLTEKTDDQVLSLHLVDAMTTAKTPPVWFKVPRAGQESGAEPAEDRGESTGSEVENRPLRADQLPSLTTLLSSSEKDLEKQLATVMQRAVFVSTNVLEEAAKDAGRIKANVSWHDGQDAKTFRMAFDRKHYAGHLQVWQRPLDIPLAQSHSLSPAAERDRYLDSNRGLIPYRPAEDQEKVEFDFGKNRLPRMTEPEAPSLLPPSGEWVIPAWFQGTRYFLPTLPGIEVTLSETAAGDAQWDYRHSIPALDEAYAGAREDSGQSADAGDEEGGSVPRRGLDFTRVQGTKAFGALPDADVRATGWLHKTEDNPDGGVTISDVELDPKGLDPKLRFSLNGVGNEEFSREKGAAGLHGYELEASAETDGENLPEFKVNLAAINDEAALRIVNNGQPLVAHAEEDSGQVITLDGEGLVQKEPVGDGSRQRRLNGKEQRRLTARYKLASDAPGDRMSLELAGVVVGTFEAADLDHAHEQGWMLHDGQGDWPRLRGFPLYPLKLKGLQDAGGKVTVQLEAILMPRTEPPERRLADATAKAQGEGFEAEILDARGTDRHGDLELNISTTQAGVAAISVDLVHIEWPEEIKEPRLMVTPPEGAPAPTVTRPDDQTLHLELVLDPPLEVDKKLQYQIRFRDKGLIRTQGWPAFASEVVTLKLVAEGAGVKPMRLEGLSGKIDWRFPSTVGMTSGPTLARLRASIPNQPAEDGAIKLVASEVAFDHPLGLLSVDWEEGEGPECRLSGEDFPSLTVSAFRKESTDPDTGKGLCAHEIDGIRIPRSYTGPVAPEVYSFGWTKESVEGTVARLVFDSGDIEAAEEEGRGPGWHLELEREGDPLTGRLHLEPLPVGPRRVLFRVGRADAIEAAEAAKDTWLQVDGATGGFVGVQFDAAFQEITDLAAEVQVALVDRYPNDAILRWDPDPEEGTEGTLHTTERNVGEIAGQPAGLRWGRGDVNVGELFWADGERNPRTWRLRGNCVGPVSQDDACPAEAEPFPTKIESFLVVSGLGWFLLQDEAHRVWSWLLDANLEQQPPKLLDGVEGQESPKVTAWASSWRWGGQSAVWAREAEVKVWHSGEQKLLQLPAVEGAPSVSAADFASENLVLLAYADGSIRSWKIDWDARSIEPLGQLAGDQRVTLPVPEGEPRPLDPVAIAVLFNKEEGQDKPRRIVVADKDGSLVLLDGLTPDVKLELPSKHGPDMIRDVVPLGEPSNLNKGLFAVLNRDSTVVQYEYRDSGEGLGAIEVKSQTLDTGDCRPEHLSTMLSENGRRQLLILAGPTSRSSLSGLLRLASGRPELGPEEGYLSLELTGRLVLHDSLEYKASHNKDAWGIASCTHRIDLYFDRAEVPIDAIYRGEHRSGVDHYMGVLAQHTFRFGDGQERIWQAPQVVRFTSLARYADLMPDFSPDQKKDLLVLDTGAVFWLKPAAQAQAARFSTAAARIENDRFRLLLQPRDLERFGQGESHAVRLPAAVCWAFNNAPLEVRGEDLTAPHQIEIPEGQTDMVLDYETSGGQHPLRDAHYVARNVDLKPELAPDRVDYFARGAEAAWLDARFLRYSLRPEREGRHSRSELDKKMDDPELGPGLSPAFPKEAVATPVLPEVEADLLWLKDTEGVRAANAGEDRDRFLQGESAYLASATVTQKHDPAEATQTLSGPTLFEFPYRLRLEEQGPQDSNEADPGAGDGEWTSVQLVGFVDGALRRLASDRLKIAGDSNAQAMAWGRDQLAARRRFDSAFVLVDYRRVVPLPRRFEASYEELPYARTWPLEAAGGEPETSPPDHPDPRCQLPSLVRKDAAHPQVALRAEADLGLLLFDAKPVDAKGAKGVASTRFRLAPTGVSSDVEVPGAEETPGAEDFVGMLRPARVSRLELGQAKRFSGESDEEGEEAARIVRRRHDPNKGSLYALTQRDDVPFVIYDELNYPAVDPGVLRQRPLPLLEAPQDYKGESEDPEKDRAKTLLPPLIDVVSWAARPGEMTRSSWIANRYKYDGGKDAEGKDTGRRPVARVGTSQPASAALRRPRAKAGEYESVRLIPDAPTESLGGRFYHAAFKLAQTVDRTTTAEVSAGLQAALVTRNAVYKSAASEGVAMANPAQIYDTDLAGGEGEEAGLVLYVVAQAQQEFLGKLAGSTDVVANEDATKTVLIWVDKGTKDADLPKAREILAELDGTAPEDLVHRVLWDFAVDANAWATVEGDAGDLKWLAFEDTAQDTADPDGPRNSIAEMLNGLRAAGHAAVDLLVLTCTRTIVERDGERVLDPLDGELRLWTRISLQNLSAASKLIAPKMSISVLSSYDAQDGEEHVKLAGYGRLGDGDFSLVQPVAAGGNLDWTRTADLEVLDRQPAAQPVEYKFDAVAYGPGGELIPTR